MSIFSAIVCLGLVSPAPRERIAFLGFSEDQKLAAWRSDVSMPVSEREVEHFSLIQVLNVERDALVSTYRASPVRRTAKRSAELRIVSRDRLDAARAVYRAAKPRRAWRKLARRTRFSAVALPMGYPSVRVIPRSERELEGEVYTDRLEVYGRGGTPILLDVVGRGKDAAQLGLGRFEQRSETAHAKQTSCSVRAFVSKDTRAIAVLARFFADGTESGAMINVTSLKDTPLDLGPFFTGRVNWPGPVGPQGPVYHDVADRNDGYGSPWASPRQVATRWFGVLGPRPKERSAGEKRPSWVHAEPPLDFVKRVSGDIQW